MKPLVTVTVDGVKRLGYLTDMIILGDGTALPLTCQWEAVKDAGVLDMLLPGEDIPLDVLEAMLREGGITL